jgi:hypothetical protein
MKYKMLRPRAYFQSAACAERMVAAIKRIPGRDAYVYPNYYSGGFTVAWV